MVPEVAKEELYGLSGNGMWTADGGYNEEHTRRSIYMLSRRTFRPAMFETFDAPEGIQSCSRRVESNTAPQSLTLLNGQWTVQEANRLAEKLAARDGRRRVDCEDMAGGLWARRRGRRMLPARGRSWSGKPRNWGRGRPRRRNWCGFCSTPTNFLYVD